MPVETRGTFCRFCHANCAMLADVEDGRVPAVRGDPDDPVFGDYTCIKGRQLPEAHNSPDRLRSCRKRDDDGGWIDIATEAALDEIAARLSAIVAEHGPHSVAIYGGTYAFQNSAGVTTATAFAQGAGHPQYQ